jgi:hypothetical protein
LENLLSNIKDETTPPSKPSVKRGNIKADECFDPFPPTGKVKEYEPFIRDYAGKFWERYPQLAFDDVLFEAVKIAVDFELGLDFSTPLRHHLKGMYRPLVEREQEYQRPLVHRSIEPVEDDKKLAAEFAGKDEFTPRSENLSDAEDEAKRLAAKAALGMEIDRRFAEEEHPTEPLTFGKGGNGARVTFEAKGVKIGVQLFGGTDARAIIERMSPDLRGLLELPRPEAPRLSGRMRAIVAHSDRQQRKAEQEVENQKCGDWNPVFTDANDALQPSIKIRERKRNIRSSQPRPRAPKEEIFVDMQLEDLDRVVTALLPQLGDTERLILDHMIDPAGHTLSRRAALIGISKGYASKISKDLVARLGEEMKKIKPEG